MSSNGNALAAYAYLTARGLPPGAATGVVGNLVAESNVNPGAVQSGGPGRGIAQWSLGARWSDLLAWASANGKNPQALQTQLEFMVHEMQAMGVWQTLLKTTDPQQAAAVVMRQYEMPADQSAGNARHRADLGIAAVGGAAPAPLSPYQDASPASDSTGNDCIVGIPLPGVGTVCLLSARNGQLMLGGLLLVAGASVGVVGLLLLAAYGFKATGAQRAVGTSLGTLGAGVAVVAPEVGAPMTAAGSKVASGAPLRTPRKKTPATQPAAAEPESAP